MKNIILIGDNCTDESIYVNPTRLCPEAPVPVVVPIRSEENPGMAGNVRANLLSMTNDKAMVTFFHSTAESRKIRYIDAATGYIMLRVDKDTKISSHTPFDSRWLFQHKPEDIGAIIISDYAKGFLNEDSISEIARYGHQYSIPTFLDTKLVLGEWSKQIFCVKINEKEFNHCISQTQTSGSPPACCCKNLVVTYASNGANLFTSVSMTHIPTDDVPVSDVCGAGDTMLAGLVLHYMKYSSLERAVAFANKVASFSVTKRGVYQVTQDDIARLGYPKMS